MPLTEAWTSTSLTGRCGRIVALSDENRGTSGVRSPDEHSNKAERLRAVRVRPAFWVLSGGTGCPTIGPPRTALWFPLNWGAASTRRIHVNCRGGALRAVLPLRVDDKRINVPVCVDAQSAWPRRWGAAAMGFFQKTEFCGPHVSTRGADDHFDDVFQSSGRRRQSVLPELWKTSSK